MHRETHVRHPSPASTRRGTPLRTALLGLMLILGGWTTHSLAYCVQNSGVSQTSATISSLPATTTLKAAKIGEIMATVVVKSGQHAMWWCGYTDDAWGMTAPKGLTLIDEAKQIYASGIPGVGLRFGFKADSINTWTTYLYPPFDLTANGQLRAFSDRMIIEFIRTDTAVGRGDLTFDLETSFYIATNPKTSIPIKGTRLTTKIDHSVYYTSCYNPVAAPTINLGRPSVYDLKRGEVTERSFAMDIRCDGMNPATKPPVKIYFEGDAVRDGLLSLDGQGKPAVASGVGIQVANDKGVALPFKKESALPLTWTRSEVDSEFYRFAGKARYVATGGEIKAGKADGTLTYVLEYN
ncbi:fimbrial protein [Burkholderia sp. F1]|uniref:fimbrial protein n=1 Tax=Burkholderia sp. F1 TaxID=3366817 RepID=UPI003D763328